jgi:hypothetical protein
MALADQLAQGIQFAPPPDPFAQYGKMQQLQAGQTQNALAQYQLGAAQRADEVNTNFLRGIQSAGTDEGAIRQAYMSAGKNKEYQDFLKSQAEAAKLRGETANLELTGGEIKSRTATGLLGNKLKIAQVAGSILRGVKDQATYDMAKQSLGHLVPDAVTDYPAAFDPAFIASEMKAGQTLTEGLAAENAARVAATGERNAATSERVATTGERNAATSEGQLKVAQGRETRLAQGPIGTSLTPEQNDALFGENGAVALGKINPNRINGRNAKMWADAFVRNPNSDPVKVAQDVASADKAIKDFGTGPQGVKVTSFNTAIDHLDTLAKLGAAMQNGDVKAFNVISNTLGVQTGQPMATMYNQAAKIVGSEVSKAIVPGVGTGKEREETAKAFDAALSPDQLKGADVVAKKLLGGQLASLEQQYKRTTKREDFADQLLSPAAKAAYQAVRSSATPAPAAATKSGATVSNW